MTDATMPWSAEWAGRKVRVIVNDPAGSHVFVRTCDPESGEACEKLLTDLRTKLNAGKDPKDQIDVTPIEQRLLALAAAGRPAVTPTAPAIVDADPDPWHETVDGAALLHEMAAVLTRHVVLPDHGAVTAALWALTTHVYDRFPWSPRLLFASAVMRSGKTLALRLVGALVARPLTTEGISAPALFRIIEKVRPCLLLDEADTYLSARRDPSESAEALRGVVNSGFQRGGRTIRCQGDNHEPVAFSTFAPVALAMIGEPPATVLDRSIVVRMRRRAAGEDVERIPPGRTLREQHEDLVRRCRRWAQDHGDLLAEAEPAIPAALNDRQADCWWPLLAVADAVGGDWPRLARSAAVALSVAPLDGDEEHGIRLLRDLRDVFGTDETLPTGEVLRRLQAVDSSPWGTWHRGSPMTGDALARLLRPFGIRPRKWRLPNDTTARGYSASDFEDPWRRYVSAQTHGVAGDLGLLADPAQALKLDQ